jgi:hypothetical protein
MTPKSLFKSNTIHLITVHALLFIAFLLVTFFFNHFAVDDYYLIGELRTKSFLEIYHHLYFEWHGRWTSNFLMVGFIQLHHLPLFLFFYNSLSVGILYLSIHRLLATINQFYQFKIDKKQLSVFAIIALSVLFFCTASPSDSWTWYTASIIYLWSTSAFIFAIPLFLKHKKNSLDYSLYALGLIYIGGSNEPLALLSIVGLLFLILRNKKRTIAVIGLLIIGSSFLINYLSPGTINRDEITPSLGFIDLILYTGYGSAKFLFFSIYSTFIPAILVAIPFFIIGKKSPPMFTAFHPQKELLKSALIIGGVVLFNQLVVIFALGGLAPDRATITSSISIAMVIIRYLFLLGNTTNFQFKFVKTILFFNATALLTFPMYYAAVHFNYAKAMDQRIEFIQNTATNPIVLKPLPKSGYLYSGEITTDVKHYKNQHLKSGLGIKSEVVLKEE